MIEFAHRQCIERTRRSKQIVDMTLACPDIDELINVDRDKVAGTPPLGQKRDVTQCGGLEVG